MVHGWLVGGNETTHDGFQKPRHGPTFGTAVYPVEKAVAAVQARLLG